MTYFLGIDVGTTSVKAGVMDEAGHRVASFGESYPTQRRAGQIVEQDPEEWLRLIHRALDAFAGYQIAAIGLTSQVNTHVFVDAQGAALHPAIVWQDGRAQAEAERLDASVTPEQKQRWWGAPMPIDASHACARMAWMANTQPDVWARTRWVMLPKDYCLFHLTGEAVTDPISNIGLVDTALRYVPEVLALVDGAADRVAPLAPVTRQIGHVRSGPFAGVPVVCGAMDAWAGLVGAGGAREGSTVYLSGTSEILGISSQTVVPTPGAIVFSECEGIRLHAAPTQSGGDAKAWFAATQGLTLDAMAELVAAHPRSAATPLFLPQLQGERAPLWDADLRAAFLGVSRQTTQADLARAVYEGVAFSARMALETLNASAGLKSDSIACGGGGFRSEAWTQTRADILGVELRVLAAKDPGVLGAATLAALSIGHYSSFGDALDALAVFETVCPPNRALRSLYDDLYGAYAEAITLNADLGKRLRHINAG
ncbi:MAG: FGGY family carbohydrate kinase [Pseudomonadota bacterium]